ncbi:GNAT family N-acetyltransferase [Paenalcaligenes sp. Me52]|uniref:GNAT family N-acetyltransferase n=1 Tax=Paenalcaligenes sp. Me52 TaxID=3392038 RepID=UPI003D2D4D85
MKPLISKTIKMRFVEEEDADFILKLRLDDRYNKFLSRVDPDAQAQRDWIKKYKVDENDRKQFYFIIERLDGTPCGTVRVYDLLEDSFCWGSWILNDEKTRFSAIESAFLVYQFGFKELGYRKSHFSVMKENERVVSFHKKMGAIQVGEDEQNYYFEIHDKAVQESRSNLESKLK